MPIRIIRPSVLPDDRVSREEIVRERLRRTGGPKSFGELRGAIEDYMWKRFAEGSLLKTMCYLPTADIFKTVTAATPSSPRIRISTHSKSPVVVDSETSFNFAAEVKKVTSLLHRGMAVPMIMALRANTIVPTEALFFAESESIWTPCLRIFVPTKQPGLDPCFKPLSLTAGFVSADYLASFSVRVRPKQTARQHWVADIYSRVVMAIIKAAQPETTPSTFIPVCNMAPSSEMHLERVGTVLLAGFWKFSATPNKIKISHLEQLGATAVPKENNFQKFQAGLGLEAL